MTLQLKKKRKSWQHPAEIIIDADYADDIEHIMNTSAEAKSLLHNLEQAAGGIGLIVNTK